MGTDTPSVKPSPEVISLYNEYARSAKTLWRRHNVYGCVYDIASKLMLIAGVAATAVAGVTAAADVLPKTVVGGVAMAAAVLTALGVALPWDARAAEHWRLANKYQSDAIECELDKLEITENPEAKQWISKLRTHQREREQLDDEAALLAEVRERNAQKKREARRIRNPNVAA